jgi:hypothetical protein
VQQLSGKLAIANEELMTAPDTDVAELFRLPIFFCTHNIPTNNRVPALHRGREFDKITGRLGFLETC